MATRFINWVRKQFDKIPSSPGLLKPGKWYVRYPDGNRTYAMTYDAACNYRDIFGGKVWHLLDNEKVNNDTSTPTPA